MPEFPVLIRQMEKKKVPDSGGKTGFLTTEKEGVKNDVLIGLFLSAAFGVISGPLLGFRIGLVGFMEPVFFFLQN